VTQPQDPIRTAQGLTEALHGLSERLAEVKRDSEDRDDALARYGRGNRRRILLTWVSLAIDIALTVALTLFAIQAHHAAASNRNLCLSSNVARAQNLQLWVHLIDESENQQDRPGEAAAQKTAAKKELDALKVYVSHVFAARNCDRISSGNP
jgi:hypothetical protein